MAESTKPVRLSKVAREFNLGMTTVVDFLASRGIEVEAKPNTKLDPETYALVKSNFQGDKETKQKAQRSATGIQERESITLASAKKREVKKEEEEPEIEQLDDPDETPVETESQEESWQEDHDVDWENDEDIPVIEDVEWDSIIEVD